MALSWITLTESAAGPPKTFDISYKPRNNKGAFVLKVKITSKLYGFTTTTAAFTVTVAGECALTALAVPSSPPNTVASSTTYIISSVVNIVNIDLYRHDQDANCKYDTETAVITPTSGVAFSSLSSWLTLSGT